jgi:integrase
MEHFLDRSIRLHNHGVAPMHRIVAFAIFSTRRLDEIIRHKRDDTDFEAKTMMVRQMKDPRNKVTNDVLCEMPDEAVAIARAMRQDADDPDRLFPFNYGQVQQAFSKACLDLDINDLRFHDLRHEGISRLFEMGRTIPQTASVSGHKSWASLKRYTHLKQSGDKFAGWKWLPIVTGQQTFQIQP